MSIALTWVRINYGIKVKAL